MSSVVTPPKRLLLLTALAAVLGVLGGIAAWVLLHLIGLITNLALFQQWGWKAPPFTELHPGPQIVIAAVLGAVIISLLARVAPVIRGHGIPETMEAVLTKESRITPRTAVAKPVSAAIAIGSGAPFGAEGPIIVTGGALGSLVGQVIRVSPSERKILLAAGAAAGMAATFGAPLAAVVLAIELLLFEFSTPRRRAPCRRGEHRGRDALAALRGRATVQGAAAPLRRLARAPAVRLARSGRRTAGDDHQPRPVPHRRLVPATSDQGVLASGHRRGDLRDDRPLRSARARCGLRRDRRGAFEPLGRRHHRGARGRQAARVVGGARRRARPAARWRRSCSSARATGACSAPR